MKFDKFVNNIVPSGVTKNLLENQEKFIKEISLLKSSLEKNLNVDNPKSGDAVRKELEKIYSSLHKTSSGDLKDLDDSIQEINKTLISITKSREASYEVLPRLSKDLGDLKYLAKSGFSDTVTALKNLADLPDSENNQETGSPTDGIIIEGLEKISVRLDSVLSKFSPDGSLQVSMVVPPESDAESDAEEEEKDRKKIIEDRRHQSLQTTSLLRGIEKMNLKTIAAVTAGSFLAGLASERGRKLFVDVLKLGLKLGLSVVVDGFKGVLSWVGEKTGWWKTEKPLPYEEDTNLWGLFKNYMTASERARTTLSIKELDDSKTPVHKLLKKHTNASSYARVSGGAGEVETTVAVAGKDGTIKEKPILETLYLLDFSKRVLKPLDKSDYSSQDWESMSPERRKMFIESVLKKTGTQLDSSLMTPLVQDESLKSFREAWVKLADVARSTTYIREDLPSGRTYTYGFEAKEGISTSAGYPGVSRDPSKLKGYEHTNVGQEIQSRVLAYPEEISQVLNLTDDQRSRLTSGGLTDKELALIRESQIPEHDTMTVEELAEALPLRSTVVELTEVVKGFEESTNKSNALLYEWFTRDKEERLKVLSALKDQKALNEEQMSFLAGDLRYSQPLAMPRVGEDSSSLAPESGGVVNTTNVSSPTYVVYPRIDYNSMP